MATGDESKLRAIQAKRIHYLTKVIDEVGGCTSKREVNKVLANHYYDESERRSEVLKAAHKLKKNQQRFKG